MAHAPVAPDLTTLLVDDAGRPITTAAGWQRQRAALRQHWLDVLGTLPDAGPVHLEVVAEDRPPGCVRQLVRYETEPGRPVEGYLLFPAEVTCPVPGVVVLHSTNNHTIRQPAGVAGEPSKAFALQLAQRGYAAFAPPCFLWEEPFDPAAAWACFGRAAARFAARCPGVTGLAKMLHDARRGVDVLCSLPFVDPARLGTIGHSLGGKETLYLAAFDERIRATVSSEGGLGLTFSNWDAPWYLGPGIREPGFALENHQVLALVPPRAFLLLGGDSADGQASQPFIDAVAPLYDLLGAPRAVELFNHRQGHSVPPEAADRAFAWLDRYLRG